MMLGFGWDCVDPLTPGVVPVQPRRAATAALVARMTVPPVSARVDAIDRLVAALVDGGVWAKLDVLVVLAAHHAQAALLNWKGGGYDAGLIGAPVFVPDRGYFTDGSDDAIDWGWAPAKGVAFQQNAGMYGAWFRKGDRNTTSAIGTQMGSGCTLNPRGSGDVMAGRINSSAVSSAGAVATGYGLTIIDRSGVNAVQIFRDGTATGAVSTAASAARSAAAMASGKANGAFADGQFCAHVAGGSLSAAEHRLLADALAGYMAAIGVVPLVQASRTLTMAGAWTLPDGDHPVAKGRGMAATGLARDPIDGCWWVGNGLASPQPFAGVTRLSPDMATVLGAYDVAGWGLGDSYNGSVQGVTFDTSDATLWAVLKATSAGGAYLLHIARDGTLIGAPIALPPSTNGIAHDAVQDQLAILFDASPGIVRWFSKAGADLSATRQVLTLPSGYADHLTFDPATGDLLASWGDNGAPGMVGRYVRGDYGGWTLAGVDTLTGTDAIEGLVAFDGNYYVANDAATHPGMPVANRVLRYVM
ncbi:hypothetical protein SAMN05192583_3118 [Sphingomonas gellani]|uniref:Uncharacterized protein n=1 Tax=Sphingomonas gellani TaxID=1166340 RepID=A0A1H8HUS5_9SPHN|nr:hypothetical protein [Sphingomonas gellani]SEN60090.1 hypothetical protein SAMN05192583_3118 [Sphingomonas gellani]